MPFNRALAVFDSVYVGSMGYDLQILDTCNQYHACMRLLDKILQYIMYCEIKCWSYGELAITQVLGISIIIFSSSYHR